ncbi:MAG: 23S rRNA (pseudouridine(1915)-N(3))-methyltransferase RlmH [Clostridiales bacterium]|nr:23S rRNA (pseudouridine(1915)-N(3))-methyltransferase RlmH [Clostridiales bacterium]
MINVTVICLGKLKESYLREASAEYIKRLKPLCSLDLIELAPERLPENPSDGAVKAALKSEGEAIMKKLPKNSRVYALCIEGTEMSSRRLSDDMMKAAVGGSGSMTFIIGSSFGLSDEVKNIADVRLSMSPMTFPHQLARIMLLEQLYRSFEIALGTKYHK